nr:replication protein A 70 kDa DNA-binding subunit B [Tanacetum cinerariifolium]
VIGTVVGIGEIVAVNSVDVSAVHNALFGTKLYINKQLSELLTFRQRYESREEYDANKNKIKLVAHEPQVVTPQHFMNGAVKKLVGSIREIEPGDQIQNGGRLPLLPHEKLSFYRNTNVTRIDQFDDNFTGFKSEPVIRILDTNEEYEEHNFVDVICTIVGIGEIVAVNSIGSKKIRRTVIIEDE